MKNELMHRVLGIVGMTLLAACSSSSSGNGGGTTGQTTPVQQTEFPAQFVSAICDNIATCCQTAGFAYDPTGCRATQMKSVADLTKAGSLDGVTWDANAAGQCIALTKQIASSCMATADLVKQYEAACSGVLVGSKPVGAACTDSAQCAAPAGGKAYCPNTDVGVGGVPSTGGGTGAPPQATCQVETTTTTVHAKQGDPCNSTCTDSPDGNGSCAGQATSGGTGGGSSGPPATGTCYTNDGLTCDFTAMKCVPLAPVGQPCVSGDGCTADAFCSSGTCTAKPKAGEPCSLTSFGTCADGLYCDVMAMKCAPQLPAGSACSNVGSNACANGHCSGGKCVENGQVASSNLCMGGSSTTPQPGTPGTGGTTTGGTAGAGGTGG
jgi:hypothetical protein